MKCVTFGEIMLRLSPQGFLRFTQADSFNATFGGSEANVAVSLAQLGVDAAFVSKLPDNDLGSAALGFLRRFGVDTTSILRGGDRMGLYFLEKGASQRAGRVIYDRAGASITDVTADDFDWDSIFDGADWFHFSGITPALGERVAHVCLLACRAAKARGMRVSCDLNYRAKLWSYGEAAAALSSLFRFVDVCIANEEHIARIFGIAATSHDNGYEEVARAFAARFGFSHVCLTLRSSTSASDNTIGAMLFDGDKIYRSREYTVHIVDRVGGGDALAAGLIFALLQSFKPQMAIDFAIAAGALKHSIEGDCNICSADEVMALATGKGDGRVDR